MKKLLNIIVMTVVTLSISTAAHSLPTYGFADAVLHYFDRGAGPMVGPYGGTWDGSAGTFPVPVSTDVVLGDDPGYPGAFADFLSLPNGSFVTVWIC